MGRDAKLDAADGSGLGGNGDGNCAVADGLYYYLPILGNGDLDLALALGGYGEGSYLASLGLGGDGDNGLVGTGVSVNGLVVGAEGDRGRSPYYRDYAPCAVLIIDNDVVLIVDSEIASQARVEGEGAAVCHYRADAP